MNLFLKDQRRDKNLLINTIFVILLLTAVGFIIFMNYKVEDEEMITITEGILDLRTWDWQQKETVNLKGEWEFYWQQLLTPQDFVAPPLPKKDFFFEVPGEIDDYQVNEQEIEGRGYFTYRAQIKLPSDMKEDLALRLPRTAGTALKVWINGELAASEGELGRTKREMQPGWGPKLVDFKAEEPKVEIIIQASNYYYHTSGLTGNLLLGPEERIRDKKENGIASDMLLFGSLLIMTFYHFGLFIFRPDDTSPLYFSLFCLIINFRMAVVGEAYLVDYFNLPYSIIYRMLLSYYLAVPVFCLFIASLYPKEFANKVLTASQILGVSFYAFVLIVPTEIASYTLPYEIITVLFAAYCLYTIILAVIKRRNGSLLFLLGFLFLFLFLVNDVLYSNRIINTGYYFHLGLFIFLFFQSLMLSRRFMRSFSIIEAMSQELEEKNKTLAKMNKFRDEFVSNTSQELKILVNNTISAAESIIHSGASSLSKDIRKDLSAIINTGEGLNAILNSFIDYAKIREERIELKEQEIEVDDMIDYIINFMEPLVDNKNIKFNNQVTAKSYLIKADKSRVIQILYNLLDNLSNTIKGGRVSFLAQSRKEGVEIKLQVEADNITFRYQDSISELREDINVDKINLQQIVTRELIRLQGGSLEVEKIANKMLSLKITLPGGRYSDFYEDEDSKEVDDRVREKREDDSFVEQEESIMIIGNQSNDLDSLEQVLKNENYAVEIWSDRDKVLQRLTNKHKLIVLDLFAFNKSDIQFCRTIRDRFTVFELPILVMAARSRPENLIGGFEVGINEFIRKPFVVSELKARVKTLITLKERVEESFKHEQDFLRAQIKPHFLYNTLDTIAFLCTKNPQQANDLIMDLAKYLRYSFDFESLSQTVPLKKELELVEFYITIQQARFRDRISIEYEIEDGLYFSLPPLALQTLVENAAKHGILQKEDGGKIRVEIKEERAYFRIRVIDNGVGIPEEKMANIFSLDNQEQQSLGLKNVNQRLRKLYNQELIIDSSPGEGTTVEFKIPVRD
ncbi:MAG: 7TM diverse intracellular signaling domain-containing protein [Halanaerobacter sp.]